VVRLIRNVLFKEKMMKAFITSLSVALFVTALLTTGAVAADKTHDGTVVSVTSTELVMTDTASKNEHKHTIGSDVKVTLDGKDVKITDLKKGDSVTVTQTDAGKITKVAAKRK